MDEIYADLAARVCDPSALRVTAGDDLYKQIAELRAKVENLRESNDRLKRERDELKAQKAVLMELMRR